ncbi:DUF6507 family protein [Marinitenerispora sediminis]|uniref:ESX-1 secretion-associated protein n=1 Tax=Marinitenerispora sediminis TaxID=1931232 RepID=A0A368T4R7_9ACTN|nr:DUF6507 family protein [Marinitenerispora sediminis]RCV57269.1 hypothetical protein DEF28_01930 [Marinitenerispora sediminis]RCV58269.1 hypothetical protein DEF23_09285 [Marinitenerispora sediminis]RCV58491.1 hypothetical protein DEF24_13320 [Marinitenerispora sediminis]
MTAWDIRPAGVGEILTEVSGYVGGSDGAGGLAGDVDEVLSLTEYASSCAASGPISTALAEFVTSVGGTLGAMVAKAASAATGCGDATVAYLDGNLEMAAEAQANAGNIGGLDI